MRFPWLVPVLAALLISSADGQPPVAKIAAERLTENLTVVRGCVNGVVVEGEAGRLVVHGDIRENPSKADRLLLTHHRRDVVWAAESSVGDRTGVFLPRVERDLFLDPSKFWSEFRRRRFGDSSQRTSKVLARPICREDQATLVARDDTFRWDDVEVSVLETPGYTPGAISYVLADQGKTVVCCGDLIHGEGRILDIYSLQDAIPEARIGGYHGYAARTAQVIQSLRAIAAVEPDFLVPSRGPIIRRPKQAIDTLIGRLQAIYRNYLEMISIRWYFGDERMKTCARRVLGTDEVDWMPMAETREVPDWVINIANGRLLVSRTGAALLLDCGSPRILEEVQKLQASGRVKKVEGVFITHYHHDHTNHAQAAADALDCPVLCTAQQADVLAHPAAYRLPCLTTSGPITRLEVIPDGTERRFHEFRLTFHSFPGQTLYHDALMVRPDEGEAIFFVGDSFGPSGPDDYCLQNRNFLRPDTGYLFCLGMIKGQPPLWLDNQHIEPIFRYSPEQIDFMLDNYRRRIALLAELFPTDDLNFGIDERWARLYPYGQSCRPDETVALEAILTNHALDEKTFVLTPHVPVGWRLSETSITLTVPGRKEATATFSVTPPRERTDEFGIVTLDVRDDRLDLRRWTEAMIEIAP